MKRIAILAIVAVLLAMTGGLVYAQITHQNITGQKLVGLGVYGVSPQLSGGGSLSNYSHVQLVSNFVVTNPSCTDNITITRVQVMDEDGAEVFAEGPGTYTITYTHPIYSTTWTTTVVIPSQLTPHESWWLKLNEVVMLPGIAYGDPGYIPGTHDPKGTPRMFTIEIAWSSEDEGSPLIGVVKELVLGWTYDAHDVLAMSEAPMVNLPLFVGPPSWAGGKK